jgi:hypothetical protein
VIKSNDRKQHQEKTGCVCCERTGQRAQALQDVWGAGCGVDFVQHLPRHVEAEQPLDMQGQFCNGLVPAVAGAAGTAGTAAAGGAGAAAVAVCRCGGEDCTGRNMFG